MNEDLDTNDDN